MAAQWQGSEKRHIPLHTLCEFQTLTILSKPVRNTFLDEKKINILILSEKKNMNILLLGGVYKIKVCRIKIFEFDVPYMIFSTF